MKTFKSFLLGVLLLGTLLYMNNTISYAQDYKSNNEEKIVNSYTQDFKNAEIEKVLNLYFNHEWESIKNNNIFDSREMVVNNDFKIYYDKYIQTRVKWYNLLNKELLNYDVYVDVNDISVYNNTYVVKVGLGHDLVFSDSSDIVQKMRNEEHIVVLENENNTLKVKNDFKVDDLKEMGYYENISDLQSLEKIEKKFINTKVEFISNCMKNINSEVFKHKTMQQNSLKNLILSNSERSAVGILSSYNRTAAVNYAANHYNDAETYKGQDCTNFISYCLQAGGQPTSTLWKPGSSAWISVQLFYDYYVTASNRATEYSWSSELGDIVQFGTNSVNWHHSTIITYVRPTTGEIFLSAHSNARYNYAYANFFGSYSTSRFIHIY